MEKLRWGILSTGHIAGVFARGVKASQTGQLVAVGSRSQASAERFARELGIPRAHDSYESLLADADVQAVYIAPPHPFHAEWAIRAAEAGKHILCEKPLAVNLADALRVVEAARAQRVLLMEAFMYRCHPQTAKAVELVKTGVLGRVGLVQATFSFYNDFNANSRMWSRELGGGGILDVGCYPVSMARLVAGAVDGKPFADPVSVLAAGQVHPQTGVDVYAAATLKFACGMLAQAACGIGLQQDNSVRIYGSDGWLHIPDPWTPCRGGGTSFLQLHRRSASGPEEIAITAPPLYALEADAFANALAAGLTEVPEMTHADTLGNMAVLDQWRSAVGVSFAADRSA
jgi:predicted dehydrogenase